MPTAVVNGFTWNYYLVGNAPNQTAGIGDNSTNYGNATGYNLPGAVTIPDTIGAANYPVTEIGQYSFISKSFTSVIIPNSVTNIKFAAFYNCASLTSVKIGNSVTTIGGYAFFTCPVLISINIPDSVATIITDAGDVFAGTSSNLVITMSNGKFGITVPSTNQTFHGNNSVDFVLPQLTTMTITSATVTSGSTTNNATIALTFTSSASTTDFLAGDITLTNGTISSPLGGSGSVYTATFTPTGQGACTINVAAGVFTASGLNNTAATTFTWTFDSVQPDITITSTTVTSGSITDDPTIELTFTSTKATNNFVVGDISLTNGALTNFAGTGTDGAVYTATFTPRGTGSCTIGVAEGAYTDAAGNTNNAATIFNWTFGRTVSFDTNALTIVNSIDANAADIVLFVLPYGEEMSNINVTAFSGTGTITYHLSTDGESVSGGIFSGIGKNLLGTNVLIAPTNTTFSGRGANLRGTNAPTNTTYILTLAANDSLTYTIVGTKRVNYGNLIPTELSFVNNRLTLQNSIVSADVDKVSFDVNAGSNLYSLEVTSLLNANRISYVLDISGGSTVSSGGFDKAGVNLLNGDLLEHEANRTYILTLTSRETNTYSIVAMTRNNEKFDIGKFCSRQGIACNNVGYNRLVTSTNNPSVSNKMRYSQLLRSRRFKPIQKIGTSVPPPKPEIPLYLFATGQIFAQSVFR